MPLVIHRIWSFETDWSDSIGDLLHQISLKDEKPPECYKICFALLNVAVPLLLRDLKVRNPCSVKALLVDLSKRFLFSTCKKGIRLLLIKLWINKAKDFHKLQKSYPFVVQLLNLAKKETTSKPLLPQYFLT